MRTDIRWDDTDPVALLLANLPRNQRVKLIRAIVTAALLPGGWAKLQADGTLTGAAGTAEPGDAPKLAAEPVLEPPPIEQLTGMSPEGTKGFLAGLQRFLDD